MAVLTICHLTGRAWTRAPAAPALMMAWWQGGRDDLTHLLLGCYRRDQGTLAVPRMLSWDRALDNIVYNMNADEEEEPARARQACEGVRGGGA